MFNQYLQACQEIGLVIIGCRTWVRGWSCCEFSYRVVYSFAYSGICWLQRRIVQSLSCLFQGSLFLRKCMICFLGMAWKKLSGSSYEVSEGLKNIICSCGKVRHCGLKSHEWLSKRGISNNATCDVCGSLIKDLLYVLRDCSAIKKVREELLSRQCHQQFFFC